MKSLRHSFVASLLLLTTVIGSLQANDEYVPGPDSQVQPGVPAGKLFSFTFAESKIFPGTTRTCWVYIPAQYTPDKPACLFVCQDGVLWNTTVVFDNLIAKGEMPVTIGVFVAPGVISAPVASAIPAERYAALVTPRGTTDARVTNLPSSIEMAPKITLAQKNRVTEYSGMNDRYARFLVEEILPAVAARQTPDGRPIRFSANPNDRAIAGTSAGAVGAFTAAWERPDAFARVFTSVCGFNLTSSEVFPILIRKFEPKPLRIFLQDGSHDTGVFAGNWWMANQAVEESLRFAGYEVNHAWGDGGHTAKHATAVFPDAMRWLWKDWPRPIRNGENQNVPLRLMAREGEGWQPVDGRYESVRGAAANARGEVFFGDAGSNRIYRVGLDGKVAVFSDDLKSANDLCFGPDGRLYTVSTESGNVLAYTPEGRSSVVATGLAGNTLTVANNGNIYVACSVPNVGGKKSELWLVKPDGTKQLVDAAAPRGVSGLALSPAQNLLFVADRQAPWIYRYVVRADGALEHGQRFIQLHRADEDEPPLEMGLRADRAGRLYVATGLGIQVAAEASLVSAILVTPNRQVSDLCFGGAAFDTLYALCGDKLYRRSFNVRAANGWETPDQPTGFKPSPVPR